MNESTEPTVSTPEPSGIVLLRQPGLRDASEAAARASLSPHLLRLPVVNVEADMRPFAGEVQIDQWQSQDAFLRRMAAEVLANAGKMGGTPFIHYFGLAEVPHAVGLGAYVGDEVPVTLYEYNRESAVWETGGPEPEGLSTEGLPEGPPMSIAGVAIIRVEISARVADEEVHEAAGRDVLADVRIAIPEPQVGLVRGSAMAERVRVEVRRAFSILHNHFPKLRQIHLFVAAPTTVCFAVGQAIKPRNSVACRTYRFRTSDGRTRQQPAILIRHDALVEPSPLSAEDRALAARMRVERVAPALEQVQVWAAATKEWARWFQGMKHPEMSRVAPFPTLPPLGRVVRGDTISPEDAREFRLAGKKWFIGDRLLVSWNREFGSDPASFDRVLRIFFAHEYLHRFQGVSGSLATGIGRFGLCLEHVDYVADCYALLHEATFGPEVADLSNLVDVMLRSLWAFDADASPEWQVRRLRRYLNWYWRFAVIEKSPQSQVSVLAASPHIEIAGLDQYLIGARHMVNLDSSRSGNELELAVVLADGQLVRIQASPSLRLAEMLTAFMDHDHETLKSMFRAVVELASPRQHLNED